MQSLEISIYDLSGNLLITSTAAIKPFDDASTDNISTDILKRLETKSDHRVFENNEIENISFETSFSYISDLQLNNIGVIKLEFSQDNTLQDQELEEFMYRLAFVYLLMLLIAVALAYFLSSYITRSIKTISDKIHKTRLNKRNEKIEFESGSSEIITLVNAYNRMIDELQESAVKLAQSEREQAWREMAKQVAHEIKNPLTPMRLSVQSFQRKFNPEDENIHQKVDEYSKTLIQQIDTLSSIASAFSNFAKMPAQKNETLNVTSIVKLALDIFSEDYIEFSSDNHELLASFDRTQLIRVVTNLVKNGIQAIPLDKEDPIIIVKVSSDKDMVKITVEDNGIGVSEENKSKIFEPKFTTKTSGMGLGLAMVKNIVETYKGSITFTSQQGIGTTFSVIFPKI